MIKKLTCFGILIFLLYSCSKKPAACIEVRDENFIVKKVEFNSCSSDAEYLFWLFEDETGAEGETVLKSLKKEGYQDVVLTCYNKSGRRTDEASATFYVGFKHIDSLIISNINASLLNNQLTGNPADLYVIYHDVRSNETYDNVKKEDLPLTFTFDSATVTSFYTSIKLMDQSTSSQEYKTIYTYSNLNSHEDYSMPWAYTKGSVFTKNYIVSETYWHFEN